MYTNQYQYQVFKDQAHYFNVFFCRGGVLCRIWDAVQQHRENNKSENS